MQAGAVLHPDGDAADDRRQEREDGQALAPERERGDERRRPYGRNTSRPIAIHNSTSAGSNCSDERPTSGSASMSTAVPTLHRIAMYPETGTRAKPRRSARPRARRRAWRRPARPAPRRPRRRPRSRPATPGPAAAQPPTPFWRGAPPASSRSGPARATSGMRMPPRAQGYPGSDVTGLPEDGGGRRPRPRDRGGRWRSSPPAPAGACASSCARSRRPSRCASSATRGRTCRGRRPARRDAPGRLRHPLSRPHRRGRGGARGGVRRAHVALRRPAPSAARPAPDRARPPCSGVRAGRRRRRGAGRRGRPPRLGARGERDRGRERRPRRARPGRVPARPPHRRPVLVAAPAGRVPAPDLRRPVARAGAGAGLLRDRRPQRALLLVRLRQLPGARPRRPRPAATTSPSRPSRSTSCCRAGALPPCSATTRASSRSWCTATTTCTASSAAAAGRSGPTGWSGPPSPGSSRFERRAGVRIDRVMCPPHGGCSAETLAALYRCGFRCLAASRPFPWDGFADQRSWRLGGWLPAQLAAAACR